MTIAPYMLGSLRAASPLVVAAAIVACAACAEQTAAQIPDVPGWRIQWHDEFDGTTLNNTNWEALHRQNSFNNEKQYYLPEQVAVVGGNLQITATNQPIANKLYRSGLVTSKSLYGPGRFEARIKLPTTQGMWPAFWLNPNQVAWPTGGEIDILENRGSQPFGVSSAYHWQTNPGPCCDQHEFVFEEYGAIQDGQRVNYHNSFHIYAVEWESTQLRFYVDGVLHFTVNETPNRPVFETPKNIILNLAVGGDFGGDPNGTTQFPQSMLVDYVRVWQPQTGLPGDYNGNGQVDAADNVVWRKTLGQGGIGLPSDGSGNGSVGLEDYDVWREYYGATSFLPAAAMMAATAVPEPAPVIPMAVGLIVAYAQRCGRPVRSRQECGTH